MVTSNHVHLLVVNDGDRDVISNSMQLVAGRTGQEFNQRRVERARTGKIATTQRRWKAAIIWQDVSFILTPTWYVPV